MRFSLYARLVHTSKVACSSGPPVPLTADSNIREVSLTVAEYSSATWCLITDALRSLGKLGVHAASKNERAPSLLAKERGSISPTTKVLTHVSAKDRVLRSGVSAWLVPPLPQFASRRNVFALVAAVLLVATPFKERSSFVWTRAQVAVVGVRYRDTFFLRRYTCISPLVGQYSSSK